MVVVTVNHVFLVPLVVVIIQPLVVGQVRRTHGRHAGAVCTVAGRTGLGEHPCTGLRCFGIQFPAAEAQNVVNHLVNLIVGHVRHHAFRRHVAVTTLGDAVQDLVRLAAPQPVVVSQVREAHLAASGSTVAYGTVVGEKALADFHGVFVLGQFRNGGVAILGIDFAVFLVSLGNLCFPLVGRSPAQQAFVVI